MPGNFKEHHDPGVILNTYNNVSIRVPSFVLFLVVVFFFLIVYHPLLVHLFFFSCFRRAVKTSDFHTGVPRFESRPGSSALGQGAFSSSRCLSEETQSRVYPLHFSQRAGRKPSD